MKNNRILSFIVVALVYLLASVAGIACYISLPFDFWVNLLLADIIATITVFVFSIIFSNASVYDPYWSVQPIVILLAFAITEEFSVAGVLLLIAVLFWGLRLTANWAYTFHGLSHQDWRYTSFKEKARKLYPLVNFFGFHFMPTVIVFFCMLPAVVVMRDAPSANVGSIIFFVVAIGAAVLQGIADLQLHSFRKAKRGGFMRHGLWKYSRHPNYLGEIIMWWAVGLSAVCVMPEIWYLLLGALLNTLMFVFISIPLADNHQARKENFANYKNETRMLFPIKK